MSDEQDKPAQERRYPNVLVHPEGDAPPDVILDMAIGQLDEALVIGIDHEGELWLSGSPASTRDILSLLEMARIHASRMV